MTMNEKEIQQFFKLAPVVKRYDENDLKDPNKQAIAIGYEALKKEYLDFMKACNDKEFAKKHEEKMEIGKSLEILGNAMQEYLSIPTQKPLPTEVYMKAFQVLVEKVREKVSQE